MGVWMDELVFKWYLNICNVISYKCSEEMLTRIRISSNCVKLILEHRTTYKWLTIPVSFHYIVCVQM